MGQNDPVWMKTIKTAGVQDDFLLWLEGRIKAYTAAIVTCVQKQDDLGAQRELGQLNAMKSLHNAFTQAEREEIALQPFREAEKK